jgi:tetratricopeptide (TPR) repeat protein
VSRSLLPALLVPAFALAAPVPKDADADRWAGKTVFGKRPPLRPVLRSEGGPVAPAPGRVYISYRVVADEGEWVRVIHNGHPAWLRKADVVRAEDAIEHFTRLIQADPANTSWPLYRGSAYREIGKYDEGIKDYDGLIAKHPTVYTYWNNRASIKITAKRYASAIADLDKAAELSPNAAIIYRNRGHAKLHNKDYAGAIADCDKAIQLEPTAAAPLVYRGQAREKLGQFAAAGKDLEEALRVEPLYATGLNARAWFLATAPDDKLRDGPAALKLIEQACDLTDWKTGSYLDTLAAASAACGKFDDAVRYQEAALRDKKFAEDADKADEARQRLGLYRQKKPYRQSNDKVTR